MRAAKAAADLGGACVQGGAQSAFLGASKKDAPLRRRELLGTGPASLAVALCKTCAQHAGELLRGKAAGDLFVEVCHSRLQRLIHPQGLCPHWLMAQVCRK